MSMPGFKVKGKLLMHLVLIESVNNQGYIFATNLFARMSGSPTWSAALVMLGSWIR